MIKGVLPKDERTFTVPWQTLYSRSAHTRLDTQWSTQSEALAVHLARMWERPKWRVTVNYTVCSVGLVWTWCTLFPALKCTVIMWLIPVRFANLQGIAGAACRAADFWWLPQAWQQDLSISHEVNWLPVSWVRSLLPRKPPEGLLQLTFFNVNLSQSYRNLRLARASWLRFGWVPAMKTEVLQ